ncbi:hypothetical protein TYRP_000422 [Tyrophagus putrescentiae]|nr:hypothetical protein TYRP_000422 [Tyrophagus putrescentiae]
MCQEHAVQLKVHCGLPEHCDDDCHECARCCAITKATTCPATGRFKVRNILIQFATFNFQRSKCVAHFECSPLELNLKMWKRLVETKYYL